MEEQILAFVELMGGRGNEELLRPLCQAAEREMAGRLREGLSPEACGPAFPVAAAWLVLAGLEAGTDGVTSFSAGDLTVHTGGDGAGAMRRQAERLMAPYLADGFAFRGAGVRVDTISVLLDRYGQCVTLYRGGVEPGREVRAFLQPLREAGREQARPSPLGLRREDRYLMLGEPDVPAAPGDRVVWRESGYEVRTAHPIYLGERLSHWWAVLAPWGKEET